MDTTMGMTREKAEAEVNKLGLTGQARAQKINELMGNTASKFEGTEEKKEQPKKKGSILKDIGTAMTNNQFGMGGAAMSNAQPTMQIKKEEQQSIDEIADATGLERDRGLLKGAGTIYSEDMAQDLKNRGVSVSDEYKAKHPEVYDENYGKGDKFQVGDNENKKFNSGSSGSGSSGVNPSTGLDYRTESFMNSQKNVSNKAKQDELKDIEIDAIKNWDEMGKTSKKTVEAYGNIDKKYINELPTFMYQRYKNGEFGDLNDPESKKNAQLRLAHFMINGIGTALSNASNVIKGKELEQSDYEKYQNSNLEQGLANRWKVNNAETEEVIKQVNKEADNEQDARIYVEQLTRDNNLKNAWNMMDQNQKLYSIHVSREIGKLIGDMNLEELSNFITARSLDGSLSEEQAVVAGLAVAVSHTPELLAKIPDDNIYKKALMKLIGNK